MERHKFCNNNLDINVLTVPIPINTMSRTAPTAVNEAISMVLSESSPSLEVVVVSIGCVVVSVVV